MKLGEGCVERVLIKVGGWNEGRDDKNELQTSTQFSKKKIIFKKAHSLLQPIYFNRASIPKEEILFNFEKYNFHRIDVYVTVIHYNKGVLPYLDGCMPKS